MAQFGRFVYVNTIGAGFCSAFYLCFHSAYAQIWRSNRSLKENDREKPLPTVITNLLTTVMNDMKLDTKERSQIKPFLIGGVDVRHIGYTGLLTGVSLGIPEHFILNDEANLKIVMKVNEEQTLESRDVLAIKSSLFLSDDAKKFALAQEIYNAKHPSFYFICLLPLLLVGSVNAVFLFGMKNPTPKIQKFKFLFQLHLLFMAVWLYALIFDVTTVYKNGWADFQAAKLGKSYLLGGIEYYQKMIERNKMVKKLDKKAPFTEEGDKIYSKIRTYHMSLPRRIIYLNDLKKAIFTNQKEPSVWDYVFYSDR